MNQLKNVQLVFWTSIFAIVLSFLVVMGWLFDIIVFKTILPDYVSMKLNTAICFMLTGTTLVLYMKNWWPPFAFLLSASLTLLSLASLSQDIFNYDLGMDQLLIQDLDAIAKGKAFPGRPSPTTSFCFSLFGLVLLFFRNDHYRVTQLRQYGLHIITLIAFIAILGYLFNVPAFYKLSIFTSMAIHTSITFLVLSIAVSIFYPEFGITDLFTGKNMGNLMARSLFIKILMAVIILGYVELILQRHNLVSVEFGTTMFTTFFMVVALYALWSTAQVLNDIDKDRKQAQMKLVQNNKNLEHIVKERTAYLTKQNKQLEDFAHIVSHNLRGPTSNLKSLLYFYKEEDNEEERDTIMDKFEKTAYNLEDTLNELLEVVSIRHESKKEKQQLDFDVILQKIIETYQGKIMETKAEITYDFSAAETVEYSSVYLESIMQNLLSNAIKYRSLERNPKIHFKTIFNDNCTFLTVSDNGIGIDMSKNGNRLFGLHKTFHKHPEAKGVGLFITKAQVEAMGGNISAQSEVGKGTTFKIKF